MTTAAALPSPLEALKLRAGRLLRAYPRETLGLGLLGLGAFFWSVKSGQFEDLDGAAMRILIDEEEQDGGN